MKGNQCPTTKTKGEILNLGNRNIINLNSCNKLLTVYSEDYISSIKEQQNKDRKLMMELIQSLKSDIDDLKK